MLTVRARRMLKADVGSNLALLEPFTHAEGADNLLMADRTVGLVQATVADAWDLHRTPSLRVCAHKRYCAP